MTRHCDLPSFLRSIFFHLFIKKHCDLLSFLRSIFFTFFIKKQTLLMTKLVSISVHHVLLSSPLISACYIVALTALFWTSRSFYEDCQLSLELWHICGVILAPVPAAVHFPVEVPVLTFLKLEKNTTYF